MGRYDSDSSDDSDSDSDYEPITQRKKSFAEYSDDSDDSDSDSSGEVRLSARRSIVEDSSDSDSSDSDDEPVSQRPSKSSNTTHSTIEYSSGDEDSSLGSDEDDEPLRRPPPQSPLDENSSSEDDSDGEALHLSPQSSAPKVATKQYESSSVDKNLSDVNEEEKKMETAEVETCDDGYHAGNNSAPAAAAPQNLQRGVRRSISLMPNAFSAKNSMGSFSSGGDSTSSMGSDNHSTPAKGEDNASKAVADDGIPAWKKKLLQKRGIGPIDPSLPAWKRALLKKKMEEQKKSQDGMCEEDGVSKPAWLVRRRNKLDKADKAENHKASGEQDQGKPLLPWQAKLKEKQAATKKQERPRWRWRG